jgi:SAM-dependent methyltransferase
MAMLDTPRAPAALGLRARLIQTLAFTGLPRQGTAMAPETHAAPQDWIAFWNGANTIYVNSTHIAVHYGLIERGIAAHLDRPGLTVLDYGCGAALHAEGLARRTGRLFLHDAAENVRAALRERLKGKPGLMVLDPAEIAAMPVATLDAFVMVSVAQYMTREALEQVLVKARGWLKPDGKLILADLIPPDVSAATDALALLRLGARHGFLGASLAGLARTALSDYRTLRQKLGLTTWTEAEATALLRRLGFAVTRAPQNIGHNHARFTLVGRLL